MPVPPGYTITTEACNAYMAGDNQMDPDELEGMALPVVRGELDYAKANQIFKLVAKSGGRYALQQGGKSLQVQDGSIDEGAAPVWARPSGYALIVLALSLPLGVLDLLLADQPGLQQLIAQ